MLIDLLLQSADYAQRNHFARFVYLDGTKEVKKIDKAHTIKAFVTDLVENIDFILTPEAFIYHSECDGYCGGCNGCGN